MSDFWRKGKAIALVFCSKMTKFEIDWFWLQIEKWRIWAIFGEKVKLYPWYFAQKWPNLKLIDFDCRLKSDEIERFLAKKYGYSIGTLLKNDQIWNWLILIADWTVENMSDFWHKSKAIVLVFCSNMTKFEIDWFWLQIEKWLKWALIFSTVQSAIKINQFQIWSFLSKVPML